MTAIGTVKSVRQEVIDPNRISTVYQVLYFGPADYDGTASEKQELTQALRTFQSMQGNNSQIVKIGPSYLLGFVSGLDKDERSGGELALVFRWLFAPLRGRRAALRPATQRVPSCGIDRLTLMSSSNEFKVQRDKPLVVVLDGGAFMGTVEPGFVSYLQDQNVDVSAYAGISIGSLISTLVCNERSQLEMRKFMLEHFCKGMARGILPPIANPVRMLFGGVMDQVPIMRRIVDELGLSPKPNLRIVAFDLLSRKIFVFQGED